jgi:DNA repair protein RadC
MTHLNAKARKRWVSGSSQDPEELARILGELRALWDAASKSEPAQRSKFQRRIVQAVDRLKKQFGDKFTSDDPSRAAYPLFGGQIPNLPNPVSEAAHPRFPADPILRLYDKDLADQALVAIPQASRFTDLEAYREHLALTLRFNAESTRRRAANYLTGRYFPCGIIHEDLAQFASVSQGRPWLGEVFFYLTCRVEKIVAMVAEEIVWPSLADGGVRRGRIADYVASLVTTWSKNSATDVGAAIVRTYERFGIGNPDRNRLNVSIRRGDLASFAYILHLEFADPGMFGFERVLQGPMRRWLLWDQDWIVKQLYACEEAGLLAKISEIDRARQFTTKFPLADAIRPILSMIKERPA